jgi:hypothetical protein
MIQQESKKANSKISKTENSENYSLAVLNVEAKEPSVE